MIDPSSQKWFVKEVFRIFFSLLKILISMYWTSTLSCFQSFFAELSLKEWPTSVKLDLSFRLHGVSEVFIEHVPRNSSNWEPGQWWYVSRENVTNFHNQVNRSQQKYVRNETRAQNVKICANQSTSVPKKSVKKNRVQNWSSWLSPSTTTTKQGETNCFQAC